MLPGAFDLELYRGDTARWQFALWQDAARSVPVDLAGVTVAAQIRDQPDSATILVTLSANITLPNVVNVALPAGLAGTLPSRGVWDLQLTWTGGDVQTILAGVVLVMLDVTR
jgi:hypothetical protein